MRLAAWLFVLCTTLGVVALFLPSLRVEVRGAALSKRTEISLYRISADRAVARRLFAAYHRSEPRKLGERMLHKVAPRIGGRARGVIDDARDAMDTLDGIDDRDVKNAGVAYTIGLWTLLALEALLISAVFVQLMRGGPRRGAMIAVAIGALVVAAASIAVHAGCREVAWQANDEVGARVLSIAIGAYLVPLAGVAAFLASIALVAKAPPTVANRIGR